MISRAIKPDVGGDSSAGGEPGSITMDEESSEVVRREYHDDEGSSGKINIGYQVTENDDDQGNQTDNIGYQVTENDDDHGDNNVLVIIDEATRDVTTDL